MLMYLTNKGVKHTLVCEDMPGAWSHDSLHVLLVVPGVERHDVVAHVGSVPGSVYQHPGVK